MTTSRALWIALGALALAIVIHAALPRYSFHMQGAAAIRVDRWTGAAVVGGYGADGHWLPRDAYFAERDRAMSKAHATQTIDLNDVAAIETTK